MSKKPKHVFLTTLVILLVITSLGAVVAILKLNVMGSPTHLSLHVGERAVDATGPLIFGRSSVPTLVLENAKSGICDVEGTLTQEGKTLSVISRHAASQLLLSPATITSHLNFPISLSDLTTKGIKEGSVQLFVHAKDCAFFSKQVAQSYAFSFDITPPRVSLTSIQHYINQGGADVATYQVSEDTVWSGIRVGPYEFKGYGMPGAPKTSGDRFAFFAFSYELPDTTPIEIIAIDQAGNESKASLKPARFFPKEFRARDLVIDDRFIETKIADVISNTPQLSNQGDPVKNFLLVNRELRKQNTHFFLELAQQSQEAFFWKDAFRPLINAEVEANFADYRNYIYNGAKIDEQVHLGFDLATYERDTVYAAGSGRIVYAGYLGIYGNTVVIDHGYGLMTLYGHLSSMDLRVGDSAKQNQKIGNTGATGLAGGDHLHFSMLIQGIQINPIEFWDQHWIDDHVYLRLNKDYFGKD